MRRKFLVQKGFTLVELLIVIALISILSVAVLATINPIEQANKAKDSTVQNDAAEVLNAYERYYANNQEYPWMDYDNYWNAGNKPTVETAVVLPSDSVGFGICNVGTTDLPANEASTCDPQADSADAGTLIAGDELKNSFVNKAEFKDLVAHPENKLWTFKVAGSGGSIYVCYIPKAKSNRQQEDKLYCITDSGAAEPVLVKADTDAGDACKALPPGVATWGTPTFDGVAGMFRCVPE